MGVLRRWAGALTMGVASLLVADTVFAQSVVDALSRARQAYNVKEFDTAIALATDARQVPALTHSASLVLARALMERFRRTTSTEDVAAAREALQSIDLAKITPRERDEYQLGIAELLFVDDEYGAAAEVFESALDKIDASTRAGVAAAGLERDQIREHVLEWWAASLDRHAQLAPDSERQERYRRLLTRLEREAARGAGSPVVAYWLAAAARGADDLDRAWSLAVAGWVQAPMLATGDLVTALRADLDRLMRDAIIPERARRGAPVVDRDALRLALESDWEAIKARWIR